MIVDHLGYAVKKIDKSIDEFERLGFEFGNIIDDYDRNIHICFGDNGPYRIELVSPIYKDRTSPIDTYLSKVGPTAYHLCYKSNDLETDISEMERHGFRMIIEPAFATAFSVWGGCKRVAFLMGRNSGIFEIVEV